MSTKNMRLEINRINLEGEKDKLMFTLSECIKGKIKSLMYITITKYRVSQDKKDLFLFSDNNLLTSLSILEYKELIIDDSPIII